MTDFRHARWKSEKLGIDLNLKGNGKCTSVLYMNYDKCTLSAVLLYVYFVTLTF